MKVSDSNKNKILDWQRLKSYKGFKLLSDELDDIIAEAERVIFATGADHKAIYSDRDMAIIKRDNAMRIKELPDRMVAMLSGAGTQPVDNPDAYSNQSDDYVDDTAEIDDLDEVFKSDL